MIKTINIDAPSHQASLIYDWTSSKIDSFGFSDQMDHILTSATLLIGFLLLLLLCDFVIRAFFKGVFTKFIKKTNNKLDDYLFDNKVFKYLAHLIPLSFSKMLLPIIFVGFPALVSILSKALSIFITIGIYLLLNSVFKTLRDVLRSSKGFSDKPVDSYLQVIQIFLIFVCGTIVFSILTGNSPWSFLVSLGAASAILMLIFKDTILGFVASIQVSANDSVRVGDWIEMAKYGADGDVIQLNLNNVRIQNFDKTIVTIPTHNLLSDSFKNYRGMQQSGGRRIKRAMNIKISSIRYLKEQEVEGLRKIQILSDYIDERQAEIQDYNEKTKADSSVLVNGRHMTNVGLFRAYIMRYSKSHPEINQNMTLMVRQLAPTEYGLPLELYMFTDGTTWSFYENVMSNVFDHLFAAIKYFDLEVFELPASDDLRSVLSKHAEQTVSERT
ncbi:mechanosensitive ion channel family protein [Sphingobacterium hungaricum]